MRPTLVIPALLVFTVPAGAQSWQEYSYPDYSFRISFPADPQNETTAYRVTNDRTVEAHVYAVRSDNSEFKVTVAELANTGLDENAVIDYAVKALSEGGEVKVNIPHRINRVFGSGRGVQRSRRGGYGRRFRRRGHRRCASFRDTLPSPASLLCACKLA
jgi:hypothetical protein